MLHLVLFILTFLTTLAAGALQIGVNLFAEPLRILEGLPFAGTLMTILLCHEFGHYIASHRHHTKATLPYFIPAPSFIGTFGAFIKMKSPIVTRRALIDIGASGPIVGFFVSLVASVVGLSLSTVIPTQGLQETIKLGDSLIFKAISYIVVGSLPEGFDILLHPVAFAGWIGLFVTSLNLLPIGQLDGGHILYALYGDRHRVISIILIILLVVAGIVYWEGWLLWAIMMVLLGIKHPPVLFWEPYLDSKRRFIGGFSAVIFILTFIPSPFSF